MLQSNYKQRNLYYSIKTVASASTLWTPPPALASRYPHPRWYHAHAPPCSTHNVTRPIPPLPATFSPIRHFCTRKRNLSAPLIPPYRHPHARHQICCGCDQWMTRERVTMGGAPVPTLRLFESRPQLTPLPPFCPYSEANLAPSCQPGDDDSASGQGTIMPLPAPRAHVARAPTDVIAPAVPTIASDVPPPLSRGCRLEPASLIRTCTANALFHVRP
jgi:hypothetical protein